MTLQVRSLRCGRCKACWPHRTKEFHLCASCLQEGITVQTEPSQRIPTMSDQDAAAECKRGMFEVYYQARLGREEIDAAINDLVAGTTGIEV